VRLPHVCAQKRERGKYLNQDETLQRRLTSGSKITEPVGSRANQHILTRQKRIAAIPKTRIVQILNGGIAKYSAFLGGIA
jgi:hypothetical protein